MNDYVSKPISRDTFECRPQVDLRKARRPIETKITESPASTCGRWKSRGADTPGQPSIVAKCIGYFSQQGEGRVEAITEALRLGEAGRLAHEAHSFKSSAATLGATHVSALCAELEKAGIDDDLRQASSRVAGLHVAYCEARDALDKWLLQRSAQL